MSNIIGAIFLEIKSYIQKWDMWNINMKIHDYKWDD